VVFKDLQIAVILPNFSAMRKADFDQILGHKIVVLLWSDTLIGVFYFAQIIIVMTIFTDSDVATHL
jgi:hypothetical protein